MASKRADATIIVEQIQALFTKYIDKRMRLQFDKFDFPIIIHSIILAKLSDLDNKPVYRHSADKKYRPPVMTIKTNAGELHFIIEDITIAAIVDGIQLQTENIIVRIIVDEPSKR